MKFTKSKLKQFELYIYNEEKAPATIEKYLRDLQKFYKFLPEGKEITREAVLEFKASLLDKYKISSINSILTALNNFLEYIKLGEYRVKLLRVQKKVFCQKGKGLTKAEYKRLLKAAKNYQLGKLYVIIQTICGTGIRISELEYITVESLCEGRAIINNKGKIREVLISNQLKKMLYQYCEQYEIENGSVFVSKRGKPLNRSNIWASMKALCKEAKVDEQKVYPHNLRHLFALTYYKMEKDVVRLADILGHSSIETTRIYTISDGYDCEKTFEKMGLVDEDL